MVASTSSLVASRYAKALFLLAEQTEVTAAAAEALSRLKAASSEADFARFLANPLLSPAAKAKAVQAVLAKLGAPELMVKFALRLAENRRLALLPAIAAAFEARLHEARGELEAVAVSAQPLSADQQQGVAQALANATGRSVILDVQTDPALLGGLKIKVGGMELDASVAGQLDRLVNNLKSAA